MSADVDVQNFVVSGGRVDDLVKIHALTGLAQQQTSRGMAEHRDIGLLRA